MGDPAMHSESLQQARTVALDIEEKYKRTRALQRPIQHLSELLLDMNEITEFVQLYWQVMETTYRILHGPTFWARYRTFWDEPSKASEAFIAIVLLIVATVRCMNLRKPTTYCGLSSLNRDEAMRSISVCEDWLLRQSRKNLSIELVQIRVLLLVAKRANSVHVKRSWEEASSVLNIALGIGLHQDPLLLEAPRGRCVHFPGSRTSGYEKEMRRRLWATISELELQAAFDRGISSSANALSAHCVVPSNVGDEDLTSDSEHLAPPKPSDMYTSGSFLSLSARSFRLRAAMNRAINDSMIQMSYDEVLHYHNRTSEELDALPKWVDDQRRNESGISASSPPTLPAFLLDIQLRQYLLLLHLPFAQQADSNLRYSYSRMVCLNTANTIIEHHSKLAKSGNYSLIISRDDVFRSSLAMCHNLISWKAVHGELLAIVNTCGFNF
jgi:hypothetical protein